MMVNVPTFFNDFFNDEFVNHRHLGAYRTSVNIVENENEYGLELVAPGFDKGDFNLKIENNELIISANVDDKYYGQMTAAIVQHDGETEVELEERSF